MGVPEFLAQEFGASDKDDSQRQARREALDAALLDWLQRMVGDDDAPAQVRRLGAPVYARRLCDALVAVQWLVLPKALGDLRARREWWFDRLHPWRLSSARDPGLELRRALTLKQQDQSLMSLWLRLADDPRDEYYAVALAGLQGMPEAGNGATAQQHCLHAALRHAALKGDIGQARSEFNREYAALRARYPRTPAQWESTLCAVQQAVEHSLPGRIGHELRDMLLPKRTGSKPSAQPAGRRQGRVVLAPVGKQVKDALATDIVARKGSGENLANRLIGLCKQDLAYARYSGDGYSFTRTLHSLCTRLLRHVKLPTPTLERLGHLVEESLIWEPLNPYLWMLLSQWFGARGWQDQREWILREATRLFPENEPVRVELAHLLMRRGESHWGEAEQLLRAVMGFSPRDEHSRVELARLLMRRGESHWGEAEQLLRAVIEFSPRSEPARLFLAVLLHRRGADSHAESKELLEAILTRNPANVPAKQLMTEWFAADDGAVSAESAWLLDDSDWADLEQDAPGPTPEPSIDLAIEVPYGLAEAVPTAAMQPSSTSTTSAAELSDAPASPGVSMPATPITPALWRAMQRLRGRGELQAAFMATLMNPDLTCDANAVPERLTRAAERGNPLAGLYVQWLAPSTVLEPPPSAWAWRACRLWQTGCTDVAVWQNLLIEFPEHKAATRFLQSQVMRDDPSVQQQVFRLSEQLALEKPAALSAEQALILRWTAPGTKVDLGKIFDLLHCAAVAPPEFEGQQLAA